MAVSDITSKCFEEYDKKHLKEQYLPTMVKSALVKKNLKELKSFIDNNPEKLNAIDENSGWNMLMYAAYFNFLEGMTYLVKKQIDLTYASPDKKNPLSCSIAKKNLIATKLLYDCGVDGKILDLKNNNLLMLSCEVGDAAITNTVLQRNELNILHKNNDGKMSLDLALEHDNHHLVPEIEKYLFDKKFTTPNTSKKSTKI